MKRWRSFDISETKSSLAAWPRYGSSKPPAIWNGLGRASGRDCRPVPTNPGSLKPPQGCRGRGATNRASVRRLLLHVSPKPGKCKPPATFKAGLTTSGRDSPPTPMTTGCGTCATPCISRSRSRSTDGKNLYRGVFAKSGNCNRSEEHTSELQSPCNLVCRLLLEKKNN